MQDTITVKEELVSPAESICDTVFDRFDLPGEHNRKLSCSSNDSSMSSVASSSDSGYSMSELLEKKNLSSAHAEGVSHANSSVVQKNLELHLSGSQKEKIQMILDSVQKLSDTEKLLLYLKLPTRNLGQPITLSNTKQEQTLAFQWIRNNLEECDSSVNLPKHEVYDQYRANCESQGSKRYLSAPDFGKIVKCMFPNVKARRLGTRGNSKYCYNGLHKKVLTESPSLPDMSAKTALTVQEISESSQQEKMDAESADQTFAAACVLVCEWANKLLGRFFTTLIELSKFLVGGSYVSTKSMAAFTVMSATPERIEQLNKRFGLEALVKSTTSVKSENSVKVKQSKFMCTPAKTVKGAMKVQTVLHTASPAQSAQVVPHTPTKISTNLQIVSDNQHPKVKLEEFTIDVNAPVYLEENGNIKNTLDTAHNNQNVLMEDVNVIISERGKTMGNMQLSQVPMRNKPPSTPKKEKKIPEKIPISPQQQHHHPSNDTYPSSAPPVGYKTPKKVGRPRSVKKTTSSPYPSPSPRQSNAGTVSPRFSQKHLNMPPPPPQVMNMHVNLNGNYQNWAVPSPSPVDNELHAIFMNSRMSHVNHPPDLQRCQSVPVPQNNCTDSYQPLTPQIHHTVPGITSPRGNTLKAKRDLTSLFFGDTNLQELSKINLPMGLLQNKINQDFRDVPFMNANLQNNVVNLHNANSRNNERIVPSSNIPERNNTIMNQDMQVYFQQNLLMRDRNNLQTNFQNDYSSILSDLPTPDELSDIPSSFEQVDSDELLQSLQTNENIWANEWNTATMTVLNI